MRSKTLSSPTADLPMLPATWQWKRLDELVDLSRGICYGIVQPGQHDVHGIPMVNSQDVLDGSVASNIAFRVSPELHRRYKRSTIRTGDILLTLVGAHFGRVAIAPATINGFNCSRAVGIIPVLENPQFIMFCLRSPITRRFLNDWANTTAQPTFNLKEVAALPIPVPPRPVQESIAETLSAFDNKIELNRRMNATLEAMARALFQSWFVDFDPVRAKAAGQTPAGIDPATADLFPSEFEDSELGEIPKGWASGKLGDVMAFAREGVTPADTPEELFEHYSLPAFDEGRLPKGELGSEIKSNKFLVPSDAVLLSKLNPRIPRIWAPSLAGGLLAICSTEFLVAQPKRPFSREFLFCLFTNERFGKEYQGLVSGTTGSHQRVDAKSVQAIHVVLPSPQAVRRFTEAVCPMLSRVNANIAESRTLAALRDALLPKMLSGALNVSTNMSGPALLPRDAQFDC